MKALVFHEPGRIAVEDVPEPELEAGDVLIEVGATAICHFDIRVFKGQKHARAGVVPGHEIAGTVVATGESVSSIQAGERVVVCPIVACGHCQFCLSGRRHRCPERVTLGYEEDGGLARYVRAPAALVGLGHLLPVPANLSIQRAALTEPLACVLNSLETCGVRVGSSVAIVGGGPMGLLHVILARAMGAASVVVSEPNEERAAVARRLGADAVIDPGTRDLATEVRERTDGLGADAVVVTAGLPETVETSLAAARRQGVVNLFAGFPPETSVPFDPNAIHYNEIRLTGSQNATPEQYRRTLALLPRLPEIDEITTHRVALEEATQAYEVRLRNEGLKSMVLVDEAG